MGKVVLFAVLTMDGCLADSSREAQEWLSLDKSDSTCLIEANTATAGIINGMIRMYLLDEIILCTIPVIAGNGCRLFLGDLPESEWMRDETKTYKDGSLKAVYRKNEGATVQKVNTSLLKRVFRL